MINYWYYYNRSKGDKNVFDSRFKIAKAAVVLPFGLPRARS